MEEKKLVTLDYEPKRQNRFIVKIWGLDVPEWCVKSMTELKFNLLNNRWEFVEIRFNDFVSLSISNKIYEILNIEKELKLTVLHLSSTGEKACEIEIKAEIVEFSLSKLDYEIEELSTVMLKILPKVVIIS